MTTLEKRLRQLAITYLNDGLHGDETLELSQLAWRLDGRVAEAAAELLDLRGRELPIADALHGLAEALALTGDQMTVDECILVADRNLDGAA